MIKKILWFFFAVLALGIGLYPSIYFFIDRKFGLLNSKSQELLSSAVWNSAFYMHIVLGGLALLIGWMQFSTRLRNRNLRLHRTVGKIYVPSVLLSAVSGVYIAIFASGGIIPASGFISLGVIWFFTTLSAYTTIRKGQVQQHRNLMIYSYAACFAAVTLRIWLPLLTMTFGDFITAYKIVAWLCWVPNIVVAYLIVRSSGKVSDHSTISLQN